MNKNKSNGTLAYSEPPLVSDMKSTSGIKQRQVGLFYFLWLGEHGRHEPYDVSKILEADPQAGYNPDSDVWGGIGTYHHWGEPLYGYYYSDDEWVVRKHMKLLISAEIDFLFFDTTNALIYENNAKLVMRILNEYRLDGWTIPKVMFYTNTHSGKTVERLYNSIYKENYMPDTWFKYEGKPLIIAKRDECTDELLNYFTIREAQWPNEPDKAGGWPWMDFAKPQRVFTDFNDNDEVINVSVAQHPQLRFGDSAMYGETDNCGRAFHDGHNDNEKDAYIKGYNFIEQFKRAIETDPPIVLVTGWNEWIAGRWQGIPERPIMFVDCANYEYSRDIEMMRGGYGDSYYRQLISCVRKYKQIPDDVKTLKSNESVEFYNFADDDIPRNHEGFGTIYTNDTAYNIPVKIVVTKDDTVLNVKIITKDDIKPYTGDGTWLQLFVKVNETDECFIINHTPKSENVTTIARIKSEDLQYNEYVCDIDYCYIDDEIEFKINTSTLYKKGSDFTIEIKAVDSTKTYCQPIDFYEYGSTAPVGDLYYKISI